MSDEKITAAGEEAARSHILGLVADYCDKYVILLFAIL